MNLKEEAISLLQQLIETPSLSREEGDTAQLLADFFSQKGIEVNQKTNNIWVTNKHFDASKPSILLNSHHDTVKPNNGYTKDPFKAIIENGKLYGLGSNDAGGCLVSLIAAFTHFYNKKLPYNLILAATAEEEVSGKNGIASILEDLPDIELAIVGEPTLLDLAVAEKGLMVIDATVKGKAGHAARNEGINALYEALPDLNTIKDFKFKRVSDYLGESKVSATIIQAGSQHNVVPDLCTYTLDVRITDSYTLQEALDELKEVLKADLQPRSMRLNSSALPKDHKIWEVAKGMDLKFYGSPTLSDQALIPYPSVKIGPGDSARSHTPDEFIHLDEIKLGIDRYIAILEEYFRV
ncbi:M20 family metallo-hydrolase [Echinicola jeungdonensis]|uniref:M20 family metallo-hydrolase n=1 Tax=Echinicola jeungdonensis TaxID=709343 RepID=A0ABV5J2D7_9BACT|nr:M20 family metallo-hydrolase [Echinicola jeungdonensis]MDN3667815.1 M20 family metallo-hydrolase [Echinicola jeungdonensis]